MDTLEDIKADARVILSEMKNIGDDGPTDKNARRMLVKMDDLKQLISRIDALPDEEK